MFLMKEFTLTAIPSIKEYNRYKRIVLYCKRIGGGGGCPDLRATRTEICRLYNLTLSTVYKFSFTERTQNNEK